MRLILSVILVSWYYVPTIIDFPTVHGNHLPEDKLSGDGVALVRWKRDNFIDRVLKSIPFFHMSSPVNTLEEEQSEAFNEDDDDAADDDDDEDVSTPSLSEMPVTSVPPSLAPLRSSMVLSATVGVTSTPWSDQSRESVSNTNEPLLSFSSTPLPPPTADMIQTTPAVLNSVVMTSSVPSIGASRTEKPLDSFMSVNAAKDSLMNFSVAPSASISMMSVSDVVATTRSSIATTVSATPDDSEPVIKMMIMSGEPALRVQDYGARDERGFVDGLGRSAVGEDIDVKNIRFMYASVLVPVMSGLVGALLITFGILLFKCVKRRRLKKVRYYGAKPGSGLYRLDQIGLLSDMSSDEE